VITLSSMLALPGSVARAICPGSARNRRSGGELSGWTATSVAPETDLVVHAAEPPVKTTTRSRGSAISPLTDLW
jgi:hypothetical protein